MLSQRIAVVGGGPAGAFAAATLAGAGCHVAVFDEKLAWEKPCGGGLTDKAIRSWPFLKDARVDRNWVTDCELIAPSGRKVHFQLDRRIAIFSRFDLNSLLLDRARTAGAEVLQERVTNIARNSAGWTLSASHREYRCDYLVIANGARNTFRSQFSPELCADDFMVAAGYYIPGTSATVQIKFLEGLHGYIWIFPRRDHFSAGICGRMRGKTTVALRGILEDSLPEFGMSHIGAQFYAHIIPSLTPKTFRNLRVCGDGWSMLGDAAGFVDPITGEGLYYALRSAEIFANAMLSGTPEMYAQLASQELLPELRTASRVADRFYSGEWMGGSVLERMVQLTCSSTKFRQLMRDLFSGAQEYSTLKQRVYRTLPTIAAEALVSSLWSGDATSSECQPQVLSDAD